MNEIEVDFPETDVAIVIGSIDIVNPVAQEDPNLPIVSMQLSATLVSVRMRSLAAQKRGLEPMLPACPIRPAPD